MLKIEKQNFEKQNGSKYSRKQCVVLVTFGVGENEKTFPIASRLLANNIDIIVIGLGENAAKNEATLNRIAKPKKKAKGKGFILVTEHVGYVFSLLENAIKFSKYLVVFLIKNLRHNQRFLYFRCYIDKNQFLQI